MYNKQLLKNEWMNEWDCVAKEYEHLYGSYKYTESQKKTEPVYPVMWPQKYQLSPKF